MRKPGRRRGICHWWGRVCICVYRMCVWLSPTLSRMHSIVNARQQECVRPIHCQPASQPASQPAWWPATCYSAGIVVRTERGLASAGGRIFGVVILGEQPSEAPVPGHRERRVSIAMWSFMPCEMSHLRWDESGSQREWQQRQSTARPALTAARSRPLRPCSVTTLDWSVGPLACWRCWRCWFVGSSVGRLVVSRPIVARRCGRPCKTSTGQPANQPSPSQRLRCPTAGPFPAIAVRALFLAASRSQHSSTDGAGAVAATPDRSSETFPFAAFSSSCRRGRTDVLEPHLSQPSAPLRRGAHVGPRRSPPPACAPCRRRPCGRRGGMDSSGCVSPPHRLPHPNRRAPALLGWEGRPRTALPRGNDDGRRSYFDSQDWCVRTQVHWLRGREAGAGPESRRALLDCPATRAIRRTRQCFATELRGLARLRKSTLHTCDMHAPTVDCLPECMLLRQLAPHRPAPSSHAISRATNRCAARHSPRAIGQSPSPRLGWPSHTFAGAERVADILIGFPGRALFVDIEARRRREYAA